MDITPELHEKAPLIQKYGGGGFVVATERLEGSIALDVHQRSSLPIQDVSELTLEMVAGFLDAKEKPELILFGCGAQTAMLPASVRQALDAVNIGYDCMDTGAACRTFNILLSEDRRVGAVLIAV